MYTLFRDEIGGDRRAVSHVLGVVLLIGIVMAAVGMIAMVGASTISSSQDQVEYERAKLAMGELADSAKATGGGINGSVDFGPQAASKLSVDESAGTFNVTSVAEDGTVLNDTDSDAYSRTLGKAVYRQGNREVAMQGGGVFVKNGNSDASVFDQRPAVSYRANEGQYPTLSMSVIQVEGETHSGNVRLSGGTNMSNMLEDVELPGGSTLKINVTSEYYQAWGAVFNESAGIPAEHITYHDAAKTVEIDLTIQRPEYTPVSGAIVSPTGGLGNTFDNYNSVVGYPDDINKTPTVVVGPTDGSSQFEVTGENEPKVDGNLVVNSTLYMSLSDSDNVFNVTGETYVNGDLDIENGAAKFGDTVYVSGDIDGLTSNSEFGADLVVAGNISSSTQLTDGMVEGDLYIHGSDNGNLGPNISNSGDSKSLKSPPTNPGEANSAKHFIDDNEGIKDANDNSNPGVPLNSDGTWNGSTPYNLTAGDYYISEGTTEEIILNTSEGPIDIHVEGSSSNPTKFQGNIRQKGNSKARIFYDTDSKFLHFMTDEVGNTTRDARLFRVFVEKGTHGDKDIRFNNNVNFTGVVYGLGGEDSEAARIDMGSGNTFHGALLGKVIGFDADAELHYDRRLSDLGFGTRDASSGSIPEGEVRYVYISDVQASA